MKILAALCILLVSVNCNDTSEKIVLRWPGGQKKVTYVIYSGDTINLKDVLYRAYYPNGKLFKTGRIKNGVETGLWSYYYQSGKIKSKGKYFDGKLDGDFETYYETGEVEQRGKYSNSKLLNLVLLNRDGTVKSANENLIRFLVLNPQEWTEKQAEEIEIDCIMVMEPSYKNVESFSVCVVDLLQKNCNYYDIKALTENQRGIVIGYITQNQKECFTLLERK